LTRVGQDGLARGPQRFRVAGRRTFFGQPGLPVGEPLAGGLDGAQQRRLGRLVAASPSPPK